MGWLWHRGEQGWNVQLCDWFRSAEDVSAGHVVHFAPPDARGCYVGSGDNA